MDHSARAMPRRHAQRKALRERWARSPSPNLPPPEHRRAHKLQARRKRKRRSAMTPDNKSSNSDTDSDSEHTRDSGYNSESSDAEAEHLKQRRAQHESARPALSDPCKGT
jgi:hypothetical protein